MKCTHRICVLRTRCQRHNGTTIRGFYCFETDQLAHWHVICFGFAPGVSLRASFGCAHGFSACDVDSLSRLLVSGIHRGAWSAQTQLLGKFSQQAHRLGIIQKVLAIQKSDQFANDFSHIGV